MQYPSHFSVHGDYSAAAARPTDGLSWWRSVPVGVALPMDAVGNSGSNLHLHLPPPRDGSSGSLGQFGLGSCALSFVTFPESMDRGDRVFLPPVAPVGGLQQVQRRVAVHARPLTHAHTHATQVVCTTAAACVRARPRARFTFLIRHVIRTPSTSSPHVAVSLPSQNSRGGRRGMLALLLCVTAGRAVAVCVVSVTSRRSQCTSMRRGARRR
jgi:hypothetical protein